MGRDHFPNLPVGAGMHFARGVLLLDDCEGTFSWTVSGTGGDDVHAYTAAAAYAGLYGLQLTTRTTGAAPADNLSVTKLCGYPESGLLVARAKLATPDYSVVSSLQIGLLANAGANAWESLIKISPNTPKVEYLTTGATLVAIPTMATICPSHAFASVEIAIDTRTMCYLEVAYNGIRVSLAGIALNDAGAMAARYTYLGLSVVTIGAAPATLYADDLYVGEYLET